MMCTIVVVVTEPAVACTVAWFVPAANTAVAGTVNAGDSLCSATVTPPGGAVVCS